MNLVHVVEPDFPEASIDIVTTDKQNLWVGMFVHTKLTYSKSRIELPLWMLSTESVHAKKMPCKQSNVSITSFLYEGKCTSIHVVYVCGHLSVYFYYANLARR